MNKVVIRVPATSANMGPGFDTLGCALNLYNTFTFEEAGDTLEITGCDEAYRNDKNLCYTAYVSAMNKLGEPVPKGLKIDISGDIPICRGLGSSSSLNVAGVMAANALHGSRMTKDDILVLTNEMEGHPDNVAPAIFGGAVASIVRYGKPVVVRYSVHPSIRFTALVPDFETSTEEARKLLPHTIMRQDAVYTVGCLAITLKALETGNIDALRYSLDDKLHQPYRKNLIDGYDLVRHKAIDLGADAFIISGSGSTCLAIGGDEDYAVRLQNALESFPHNWVVYPLTVDSEGAKVLSIE